MDKIPVLEVEKEGRVDLYLSFELNVVKNSDLSSSNVLLPRG